MTQPAHSQPETRRRYRPISSEQVLAPDGGLLGNFPQALSHIGLVNAAVSLQRAEAGAEAEERDAPP